MNVSQYVSDKEVIVVCVNSLTAPVPVKEIEVVRTWYKARRVTSVRCEMQSGCYGAVDIQGGWFVSRTWKELVLHAKNKCGILCFNRTIPGSTADKFLVEHGIHRI
jgi:hypothetical protein